MLEYSNNLFFNKYISFIKDMSLNCIIKNEEMADYYETIDTDRDANRYIASMENRNTLSNIVEDIPRDILLEAGMLPEDIKPYLGMPEENIPARYRDRVIDIYRKRAIDSYVEKNNYYRMLAGMPDFGSVSVIYNGKPIEKYPISDIIVFYKNGVLDQLKEENPKAKYLNHLGLRSVDPYTARRAQKFQLLYVPEVDDKNIYNRFKETYERNRIYTMRRIYSDAFKYNSKEYESFISLFIVIQTISDMFVDIPDIIIRKEFFDDISIRDMFLSHDITYFPEIPRRYQMNMIMNLNELLNNKSTNKCIVDICKLFGFDNIQVFKYYLLKDRRIDPYTGDYYSEDYYINNEDGERVLNLEKIYDLKFVKVPIEGNVDDYIRDKTSHVDYNTTVLNDPYWLPEESMHKEFKYKLLEQDFNYELTKYLSVDLLFDLNKLIFDMVYFFNMVFDNKELEENLRFKIPSISDYMEFKLTDVICFLYILIYYKMGISDTILNTQTQAYTVLGFNFKADLINLSNWLNDNLPYYEEFRKDIKTEFNIPLSEFANANELIKVFANNKNLMKFILKKMYTANDYYCYRAYKRLYDTLFVTDLNTKHFKDSNGNFAQTYTNYIKSRDKYLYKIMEDIEEMNEKDRINKLSILIDDILLSMENYTNTDEFEFSFIHMTNFSSELIRDYIYKVIDFYKSYTVQLLSINTIYTIGDKLINRIQINDKLKYISKLSIEDCPWDNNEHTMNDILEIQHKQIKASSKVRPCDRVIIVHK